MNFNECIVRYFLNKVKKDYIFTLLDIGAAGGIDNKWVSIADYIKIIAFEPDDRKCDLFGSVKLGGSNIEYFPYILYSKSIKLDFYIAKKEGRSSIYKPNLKVLSQFENIERFHTEEVKTFSPEKVKTLDLLMKEKLIKNIDFIKLDTEGSELLVLEGGKDFAVPETFGMHIEAEFIEIFENQPLFRDVDKFMQDNGFQLIDIRRSYWKRKDYYDYIGKGQLVFGNMLYFKRIDILFQGLPQDRLQVISKIYKAIAICLVYKMFDYAVSIAKVGFQKDYFSKKEYEEIVIKIKSSSKKEGTMDFIGKQRFYSIISKIYWKLKPKSFWNWTDSDDAIGNINMKQK